MGRMEQIFQSEHPARDKYLSRLFGIFSEEVVRHWTGDSRSPYVDLGRPTLRSHGQSGWHTLDFTLERLSDGAVFVSEMKCELEYEGYRYLRLAEKEQVEHHQRLEAFQKFLTVARDPTALSVRIGGRTIEVDGSILIWGATTADGAEQVARYFGLSSVLSVESMLDDLVRWKTPSWATYLDRMRRWTNELFDGLDELAP